MLRQVGQIVGTDGARADNVAKRFVIIRDRDHYCWIEDLLSNFHITFVVEGNDTCLTVGDREIGSGLY